MNICISCFIMMQENKKMLNRPHTRPISLGCRAQLFIPIHLLFNGIDGVLVLINTTRNPSFLRILRPPPQQSAVALLSLSLAVHVLLGVPVFSKRVQHPARCPPLLQARPGAGGRTPSASSLGELRAEADPEHLLRRAPTPYLLRTPTHLAPRSPSGPRLLHQCEEHLRVR